MKLQIGGHLYCIGITSAALMLLLTLLMPHVYSSLGLQLPGITSFLYSNLSSAVLIIFVIAMTIASFWTSFYFSHSYRVASCVMINVTVLTSCLFYAATMLPFTYIIESLGGNDGPVYLNSALWVMLPFCVMLPFHVMTILGLRNRA